MRLRPSSTATWVNDGAYLDAHQVAADRAAVALAAPATFDRVGVEIDLGTTARGWLRALDTAAPLLLRSVAGGLTVCRFLGRRIAAATWGPIGLGLVDLRTLRSAALSRLGGRRRWRLARPRVADLGLADESPLGRSSRWPAFGDALRQFLAITIRARHGRQRRVNDQPGVIRPSRRALTVSPEGADQLAVLGFLGFLAVVVSPTGCRPGRLLAVSATARASAALCCTGPHGRLPGRFAGRFGALSGRFALGGPLWGFVDLRRRR